MRKQFWAGLIAAICTATIAAAQTSSPTAGSQTPSSSQSAAKQVTVTGCVQKGSSSATSGATGTSGTTGASSTEPSFILTNASSGAGSTTGGTTAGTAGAATPSSASSMGSTYRLDADESKLSAHVGHKVEITGTLESASAGSSSTSTAGSASSSSSNAPKLKVDTVRMIAASCTE